VSNVWIWRGVGLLDVQLVYKEWVFWDLGRGFLEDFLG